MRTTFLAPLFLAAACSVPAKQPATGSDAAVPPDPSGAPNTQLDSSPPEFSNQAAAVFEFRSDNARATFRCSIDRESEVPCQSPYTRTLGDGSHSFAVRAVVGDQEDPTPADAVFTIDTVAPDTMFTQTPPAADNSTMVMFTFTSNEQNVTYECSLDSSPFAVCESGNTFGPMADGSHAFAVRARDRAGNVDDSPAVYAWRIDTAMPDTQILSGPQATTSSRDAQFTFDSPDAGAGATFTCKLDDAPFVPCTSPAGYTNLPEGMHTFQVQVRDAVGNTDPTPATETWTIDLTPPDTTITSAPTGTINTASATIEFTSTDMGATFMCSLDSAAFAACTSPYSASMLAQGPHTFAVRATDAAGNVDQTPAMASWTVDTTMMP